MSNYWFKPHAYGHGATPCNWRGWAATLVFAAILAAVSWVVLGWQPNFATAPEASKIIAWAVIVLMLIAGFIRLAWAKTDGQWAWRWGK
jgi:hypothetical protein